MRIGFILYILGALIFSLGSTMIFPLFFALYYGEGDARALVISFMITTLTGLILFLGFRRTRGEEISHKEGFLIVSLGWICAGIFGTLPYLLSGTFTSFIDSFFEAISGFTTTGATVLTSIDELPHGILFWRSLTHWLGGMGIILLSIAILPLLGVGGMQLYRAEVPGPVHDKIKPRVAEIAKTLWGVYILLSAILVLLLLMGGMSFFDSLCHTFGTMATGGFSTNGASIGHFDSLYFDTVITVFMLIAGTNFALHYKLLLGDYKSFWKNSEFRLFISVAIVATVLVTINLKMNVPGSFAHSFRYASFQVASILTTTGFVTADFETWPCFAQMILLLLMLIGGSAGSTGGGIKCLRILLFIKQGYRELYRHIHPRAVVPIKLGGQVVPAEVMGSIWGFFFIYLFLIVFATLIMGLLGLDLVSAFAAVTASLGNIGPGLGSVGPMNNYQHIPLVGKWVLIFCMLLGRLEIYTLIVLFIPEFWRK